MADSVPLADGATNLDPVDSNDVSSGGTSVDTIVVGVTTGDSGAGFVVGDPGLAASADSGGASNASGVRANPLAPIGSSGSVGDPSLSGGSVEGGGGTISADSTPPGSDPAAILGAGGIAPAGSGATADALAPIGSSGSAGNPSLSGGSIEGGGVAASSADSTAPGSDETAILGAGGTAPAGDAAASGDMVTAAGVAGGAVESMVPGGGATSTAVASVAAGGSTTSAGGAMASSDTVTAGGLASGTSQNAVTGGGAIGTTSGQLSHAAGATSVGTNTSGGDLWLVSGPTAGGLTFSVSFDQPASALSAGFETDVISAFQYYADTFNDSGVTLYYNVGSGEVGGSSITSGDLGESFTNFGPAQTYSSLSSHLVADAKSPADSASLADLPGSDPTSGKTLDMAVAEEKALGFNVSGGGSSFSNPDGYIGFSSVPSTFDYTSGQVPTSGLYDFIGTVEHEISEVMGRNSWLNLSGGTAYSAMDLFRYSSSGTHQFTAGSASYFSTDNGSTNIYNWNNFTSGLGGDLGD